MTLSEFILGIISAVVVSIIPSVTTYITKGRQWKNKREKSSRDLFVNLFYRMIQFCLFYMFISLFVITLLKKFEYKKLPTIISIVLLVVFGIITYFYESKVTTMTVRFRCTDKWQKFFEIMAFVISISLPIMLVLLFISNPESKGFVCIQICSAVLWLLLLAWMILLDGKKDFKYKQATIYLKKDIIIENIDVTTMCLKGGWVIATKIDNQSEVRFKNQDIERIEYTQI